MRLLLLAGDDTKALQTAAAHAGLADVVTARGNVSNMAAALAACDALVHPTWYDTASRVVLEALAAGRPVITTEFDGSAEVVRRFGAGVVISGPEDATALRTALDMALDPVTRSRFAARAANPAVIPAVSMGRHVDDLLAVYSGITPGV